MAVDQKGPDTFEGQQQLRKRVETAFGPRNFLTAIFPPSAYFEYERHKFLKVANRLGTELRALVQDVPEFKDTGLKATHENASELSREGLMTILEFLEKDHDEKTKRVIAKAMEGLVSSVELSLEGISSDDARIVRSISHLSYAHNDAVRPHEHENDNEDYRSYEKRLFQGSALDHLDAGLMLLAQAMANRRKNAPVELHDNRFE